ncbi:holin (3TMs family) [Pacificibacter maritimus]|uniref:Holin (3TMs family) n=1 Tax=Pacificibacter maritimus TaxID=762213 RepID=A0A3N4UUE3_9RHOB|nr:holin family protein [Pacificibacter maritimus]RPE71181.1 holin (3TMs family) [Pacificibacter maritimus]
MGIVSSLAQLVFGGSRNVIKETAEVFLENAENGSARETQLRAAAMDQFAKEFAIARTGRFDRFMDGLNRIPRPLMAFGTIGLCVTAMVNPIWFASRMQGIALIPEPLWWLMGAIVSFYFGARYQASGQDFQRSIAATVAQAPIVTANIRSLEALRALEAGASAQAKPIGQSPYVAGPSSSLRQMADSDVLGFDAENPALMAWRGKHDE